ncbi:MAG TPA: CDP-alcohol phosphatidyltransferase family protein [Methylomirabilota bacterium]|nr:CDP-alcohol phosphatidyltransferase family protein [Methylomirabilota bacterium]
MKARIWTVPNQITLLRLGFLPFFLILILYDRYDWALIVLVFVALTDAVDGYLARRLHQKSALGAYLDPIADKLLLSSSFIALAMEKKIAWWLTVLVLSRDVLLLVVAGVILIVQGYRAFPPSLLGKATTFFEIALVFFVVFAGAYPNDRAAEIIRYLGFTVAVFVTVSGFHYAFAVARRLHTT